MAQTCSKCSRVNPSDAVYCYFDGFALGNGTGGAALAGGRRNFSHPFVFPSGRNCRNFDELAMACQQCWDEACDLLQKGFFESFLSGMGRADLALAAKEAARFPDQQRGMDQLLDKIPSDVLDEPMLRVEPQQINLGILAMGTDRGFDLNLENQGMRLVYGTVISDNCAWLTVGEGAHEKTFDLLDGLKLPVKIRGDRLRAGPKPLEGRLLIESNAGSFTVPVRVQVPVKPFATGILAGAASPRQIAEKARANAREAAALFEHGDVERWYKENGWVYPVQAPSSSGLAAVQQFFEALGLTPPPKVDINKRLIRLQGDVGQSLQDTIEVATPEKRPVWANATSDAPWLEMGRAKLNGRTASIPLVVASVPNRPGERIGASITITSNGNQKFVVPVELAVGGGFEFTLPPPAAPPVVAVTPVATRNGPASPLVPARTAAPAAIIAQPDEFPSGPPVYTPSYRRRKQGSTSMVMHVLPAALLSALVIGLVILDVFYSRPAGDDDKGGSRSPGFAAIDPDPLIQIGYNEETHRFGIVDLTEKDPTPGVETPYKRLTYNAYGGQNNTVVKVDGEEFVFGLIRSQVKLMKRETYPKTWTARMRVGAHQVYVTQTVMLVPGDSGRLDTCLIRYTIENAQDLPALVGVRAMIDTFIGTNDGVPFSVPGHEPPLVTDLAVLEKGTKSDIPDYIQALESPDLGKPGTIAHIGLKGFRLPDVDYLEVPEKVVLCRWPGRDVRWGWNFEPINQDPLHPDSCLVIYWPYLKMRGHEKRDMAFTYGLSGITSDVGSGHGGTQVGMFVTRAVRVGDEFTVTGFVKHPRAGKPITLELPDGLRLVGNEASQQLEAGGDYSQVSWRVKAEKIGEYDVEATHGGAKVSRTLKVLQEKSIFD